MIARLFILLLLMGLPASARACAVCFGAAGSQDSQALSVSIGLLLGVLVLVLGSIVSFIVYLARRAKAAPLLEMEHHAA